MTKKILRQRKKEKQAANIATQQVFAHAQQAYRQGNLQLAVKLYQQVIKQQPDSHESYNNIGQIMEQAGNLDAAVGSYKKAIAIKKHPLYLFNLAGPYFKVGALTQAEDFLRESLKLDPDYPMANMNLSIILQKKKKFDEAEEFCNKAVAAKKDYWDAFFQLAKIKIDKKENREAIQILKELLRQYPDHEKAQAVLVQELKFACDWQELEKEKIRAKELSDALIKNGKVPGITPFLQITFSDDPTENFKVIKAWSDDLTKRYAPVRKNFIHQPKQKHKLTIGYISADLREHAVGLNIQYLFAAHDREKFQINAYSTSSDDGSEVRKHIVGTVDKFVDINAMSHLAAAKKIYEDNVDILLDVSGYTAGGRMEIAALRPAPIQVNLWGWPATTASEFIDYIIADDIIIPESSKQFYSEKIVYLPGTHISTHRNEKISEKKFTKAECRIPENAFIFSAFNQTYKIEAEMFAVWMEILKEVPDSILWVRSSGNELAKENLYNHAKQTGVVPERIIFTDKVSDRAEYYSRLQLVDLALDAKTYNGGSTTMDALWAGIPVVTLLGKQTLVSRMSASHINAANMPEMITQDLNEYKNLAIKLAKNPGELKKLKDKLWQQRMICPLFDTVNIARNLELAYRAMWDNYAAGNDVREIRITK